MKLSASCQEQQVEVYRGRLVVVQRAQAKRTPKRRLDPHLRPSMHVGHAFIEGRAIFKAVPGPMCVNVAEASGQAQV
jgi:hypothetical protein